MSGTQAQLGDLEALASQLRTGAMELDGSGAPPPAPQVGVATEAVAGAMAMLALSAAEIVEAMNFAGAEVAAGRNLYDETDHGNADDIARTAPNEPR
ncbi:hypothetical protein SAMN05421805_10292 [Saccharopolyspora antimicrobica]|uniref:Excreted virulence factor EspC, type VII ESX diderm n=1 Tax=Saccharopolyspora antimicrobica TaxID=455193 RepID=A0A1I4VAP5_9PSEU|nr:hypothetical protein [Saccharopolyspora antimicrobica]RKT86199.1 hypothetical protein ATL45_4559 [Saccharopolyspora antimicrobica]SFM98252.1 hypothetical protein SAMN05421805_10292 [Saccharopolyspora antimicrobica]